LATPDLEENHRVIGKRLRLVKQDMAYMATNQEARKKQWQNANDQFGLELIAFDLS
jgi:hypothetical protein